MASQPATGRTSGYCALCWSSCGCISVVEAGRLVAVEANPDHPTGQTLCGKGQAAPEYVYSDARVLHPMKRTRPKGDPDPGWVQISWDEALDLAAEGIRRTAERTGVESVVFSVTTSAGTAMQDSYPFVERLRHAVGSPNMVASIELCDFSKDFMYPHTFGVSMPVPEVENSDCIVLWGHNPGTTWMALATRITAARRRGAKLVVMDPVRVGFAAKADEWLRVRPGSDGALALSMAHVMIDEDLFDAAFVSEYTNAPFLVREDTGALLTGADVDAKGSASQRVGWDAQTGQPVFYETTTGTWLDAPAAFAPALRGRFELDTIDGVIACQPVFEQYASLCAQYPPEQAADIVWVSADQIRQTARLVGSSAAVSCSSWAGLEMHSNTSQTGRAIACLYALTGSFDAPGGNVVLESVPVNTIFGQELLPEGVLDKALGREQRSLGPESIFGWITTDAFYTAALEAQPYAARALVSFGLNMLLSHADSGRGSKALESLDFMVHSDLFMTPTAHYADVFLPVNTPWERDAMKTDFYADQRATAHLQYRPQVIEALGESRSDAWIAMELGKRLGHGDVFWDGDIRRAREEILAPSGVGLETLENSPGGVTVPLETRYRKYAAQAGVAGFSTPSKRVELYSETLHQHGYSALPEYLEPAVGPLSRADLKETFPLVLTDTKSPHYIHSQYRHVGRLRRHEREPRIDVHPETARARGIEEGDWVNLRTPHGGMKVRARFAKSLDPRVIRATVGWWQACGDPEMPDYDPLSDAGANLNRTISNADVDPIGGCVPHKSYLCEISRAGD